MWQWGLRLGTSAHALTFSQNSLPLPFALWWPHPHSMFLDHVVTTTPLHLEGVRCRTKAIPWWQLSHPLLAVPRCNERNIQQDNLQPALGTKPRPMWSLPLSWDRATDLWDEYASLVGHQWQAGNISFLLSFLSVSFLLSWCFLPGDTSDLTTQGLVHVTQLLHNWAISPAVLEFPAALLFSDCLCERPHGFSFQKGSSALHPYPHCSHIEQEALGAGKTSVGISVLIPSQAELGWMDSKDMIRLFWACLFICTARQRDSEWCC